MKKMLFIIDPLESLTVETDTTLLIMAEAAKRGHAAWTTTVEELKINKGKPQALCTQWISDKQKQQELQNFDIIFMRKDPPFDMDYIMATYILSLAQSKKTFVINNPTGLRNFNEKLGIFQFQKYIPPTLVSKKKADFEAFLKEHKSIVLKPLEGFGGHGVFVLSVGDKNKNALLETMTKEETVYVMAQKYLSEVKEGDKRILILNGKILGQHNRLAAKDDHRSNISAGGTSAGATLNPNERAIAEDIGAELLKQGIYFAGLDMIGKYITEINITSPTGVAKINEHDGVHLEEKIVDFLEQ